MDFIYPATLSRFCGKLPRNKYETLIEVLHLSPAHLKCRTFYEYVEPAHFSDSEKFTAVDKTHNAT